MVEIDAVLILDVYKRQSVDKLPQAAQEFLSAHFKDLTVAYAVEEQKYTGKEYEVVYTDRTEVEFRSDGQWESVGRKYSPVPALSLIHI